MDRTVQDAIDWVEARGWRLDSESTSDGCRVFRNSRPEKRGRVVTIRGEADDPISQHTWDSIQEQADD